MKTEAIFNEDLHFEHEQWRRELLFWEDELKFFQKRLEELIKRWTGSEVLSEIEQYQNHFFIHSTKIDELKEGIHGHEMNMAAHERAHEVVLNREHFKQHLEHREKMDTQRDMYNDLKKRFFRFLSKNM
ncbi:hypothetical protein [Ascidiimonas aurantiaca]|uniref:hypothetical protein n=1 Tax=Ascidiimonas aurantiaca TaxID=1685432 RepID=UPI0030ED6DE1